jgi:hypothetical protein
VKVKGYVNPSQTVARRVTICPICQQPINPGEFIVNPGLLPPEGNKHYWWCHPSCADQLYPNPPQPIAGLGGRYCWVYVEMRSLATVAPPRPVQGDIFVSTEEPAAPSETQATESVEVGKIPPQRETQPIVEKKEDEDIAF